MESVDVPRAWKDREYFEGLVPEQRAEVPDHPAGVIEIDDDDLERAAGGWGGGSRNPGRPKNPRKPQPKPTPQPTPQPSGPWRRPREGRVPSWYPGY